ncbi:elongator complex protein 4 isoform X1 [Brachyhypopomus gauderio]|uniref:elongator complex protein 4 isoform X1 n=1 Tax=Brachyhypopomus gauderio TaxID=698409 RepID=UPI004041C1FE
MAAHTRSMGNLSNLSSNTTISFQKKTRSKLVSIPGTRPSVQNGQLIVSTGVASLDYVIGGGLAVGTLLLIEEDHSDSYSHMLLRYFLAEGVVCGHELFLASARDHPDNIMQMLPSPILDNVNTDQGNRPPLPLHHDHPDALKIAWRYQSIPKFQTTLASSAMFGHCYDLSKPMEEQVRQATKCHTFYLPDEKTAAKQSSHLIGPYAGLLQSIQALIQKEGFDGTSSQSKVRNVLRVGLHSLGSALWGDDLCCRENPTHCYALTTFLYALRALLRSSLSVAMVTIPSHLIQKRVVMERITRLSDIALTLESFQGSEKETSPLYKDYHGLLQICQVPHLNCLSCAIPDTKDLGFKLKKKLFAIEKLHLPPDLSESVSRVNKVELPGCGPTNKHLDF